MRILGTLLLVYVLPSVADNPVAKVPIGKDTTTATGPLDKEGYIDYEVALNERLGKGITPEKNANVLIWKALGPKPEGGRGMPPEFFKALGIAAPPEKGDYLVDLGRYLKDNHNLAGEELNEILEQHDLASVRPWSAKTYPHIASWLNANEKPLAVVIAASQRPDYFNPLATFRTESGTSSGLIAALLPAVQKCRALAHALTARAMLRTAEGRYDEAWEDLLACHRLGRLLTRGATQIEALVGIAIEQIANNAELTYLERAKLTAPQVRKCLQDLQSLPPIPPLADKIDLGERFMFLDCVQMVRRDGIGALEVLSGGKTPEKLDPKAQQNLGMIDWAAAFRNGNRWYDRLVAAMRVKDRAEREKHLDRIERDLKALRVTTSAPARIARLLLSESKPDKTVGAMVGDIMVSLLMPATRKVQQAADRIEQVKSNQYVAFALAVYRLDNGRYPATLAELEPKYLATVPGDLFSGKALIYRPEENGYLFYSVGVNGKDDGGRWYDDDPPGDDLRVRVPPPKLKKRR
jgi:tetratricopeptide (TPR) repeat protein